MLRIGLLFLGSTWLASLQPAAPPPPPRPDSCPIIEIHCGSDEECKSKAGRRVLSVTIAGISATVMPTLTWCVSAGTIVGGQGTGTVVVDASDVSEEYVTVVVVVGRLPKGCPTTEKYLMELPEGAPASAPGGGGAESQDVPGRGAGASRR